MEQTEREPVVHLSVRVTDCMKETLDKIAQSEGRSRSEVCRDMIEKGLASAGYISGTEDINERVFRAVQAALHPQVERLASISAKAAQIAAASYFLTAWTGQKVLPRELLVDYTYTAENARKLGVQYLKVTKDRSLDDFIAAGLRKMDDGA